MARAPIDYTLNVINPIQAAMQGYSFGLKEVQAEKDEARNVERFGMEKEKFAMAQRAEADRRAAAARSAAAAQRANARKQEFYSDFSSVVNGEIPRKQLLAKYPDFASTMKSTFELIPNDVADARVATGKRIQNALNNGRDDIATSLVDEQILAAQNTPGQEAFVRQLEEMKSQIEENPRLVFEEIGIQLDAYDEEGLEWRGDATPDQPAEVRELQFRAEQGGLVPGTPEYQEFMRSGGASLGGNFRPATVEEAAQYGATGGQIDASSGRFYPIQPPSGMSIETGPDGVTRIVQGPGVTSKPFTEGQSKDVVFATRAQGALDEFNPVADRLTSRSERLLEIVPLGFGRDYQDPDYQVAQRAGTEFLQAILRKDTGAAITEAEQAEYGRVYLPQPGDSAEVLKSRAAARNRAVAALQAGMSPEQMLVVERASGLASQATTTNARPRLRFDADGNLIND